MSDWTGFWLGLGFAAGCYWLGVGLESFGEQIVEAIKSWKRPFKDERMKGWE